MERMRRTEKALTGSDTGRDVTRSSQNGGQRQNQQQGVDPV